MTALRLLSFFALLVSLSSKSFSQHDSKDEKCNRTIKFSIQIIRATNGNREKNIPTTILLKPKEHFIQIISQTGPNKTKELLLTIDSITCNLDSELKSGSANFYGYLNTDEKKKMPVVLQIECNHELVSISFTSDQRPPDALFIVDKWEALKQ